MKTVIIGANSFIARNLIYELKKSKECIQLNLYDIQNNQSDNEKNYTQINLLNKEDIKKIDFNCDIIYIFTGKTGTLKGFDEYEDFLKINELTLLNILDEYIRSNSKAKIIFPSTRLVYKGKEGKLNENSEKEFKTIYSINKFACEEYLKMYNRLYNIPYVIFRICVPYGTMIKNASSYGTIEFMLKKAKNKEDICLYSQGELRRTFTHIKDLTGALIAGANSKQCLNDIYNIGGEDLSLYDVAKEISKKYEVGIKFIPWDDNALKIESGDTVFDSDKLDRLLNFKYKYKLKNWIEERE